MQNMPSSGNVIAMATYWLVLLGLLTAAVIGLIGLIYLGLQWFRHRKREEYSLGFVLLEVRVPRDNEIKVDAAEQMFASIYTIHQHGFTQFFRAQDHFAFEIVALKEDIRFYVSCPEKLCDLLEKQIYGAYPAADIKPVDEYNIFSQTGKVSFASLKLKNSTFNPIKQFRELPTDSLSSLTAALAKMGEGEGAAIQIVISPAGDKWSHAGSGFISKTKKKEADPETAKFSADQKTYEAIDSKVGKPGFQTVIRIVVSSTTKQMAEAHLKNIIGAFAQFTSSYNGFENAHIWFKKMFMVDFIYRYMPLWNRGTSTLNAEELATVFHFPNKMVETPHIRWLNAKRAPAPAEIPKEGMFLGVSRYRGITRKVHISQKDRQRHMYIIGKTGTGKSEFLKEMITQDIQAGKGICFIDPHDTVEQILELIPPSRAEDVIYFNPSDLDRPLGMNIMEAETEAQQHMVVSAIINLMYKLYDPHKTGIIGPRFEHAIRNAMLTVMAEPGATFIEVVRCLTDARYVQELLPKVKDPMVRRYWTDQIAQTSDFHKSEVLDYIVSKFGRFVTDKMMRNIIGQSKSAFDFRKVMDERKILLINLAKGRIGEENSNFLGLILVPKILIAAMSRQDVPEEQRPDFYLYVDEFQNFATPDFAVILSEARKYHLNLTVANQFVGQVEEEVKQAVFGNVGTLVAFRVGVTDANFLQHEFTPTFNETDLTNIERFNVFIKTIVDNEPMPPFSMDLTKDMDEEMRQRNQKVAEMIKQLSRLKYGQDKYLIEEEIVKRAKL
jgi:hypothetical protein